MSQSCCLSKYLFSGYDKDNVRMIYPAWEENETCYFKVGLSPSKKTSVICFMEIPLKMTKNAFYFILKTLFVFKIFSFLLWHFGHIEKTAWLG